METPLIQAAKNIFSYFQGKADINQVRLSIEYLYLLEMASHKNLILPKGKSQQKPVKFDFDALFSSFNVSSLIHKWTPVFSKQNDITGKEANQFIRELFSSIDLDTPFFTYQNIIHYTYRYKDRWTDFHIVRPKQKAGWCLHLTVDGSGHYNFIRKDLKTSRGDMVLFNPSAYLDVCRSEDSEDWTYYSLMFQPTGDMMELLSWPEVADGTYYLKENNEDQLSVLLSILKSVHQQGASHHPVDISARAAGIKMFLLLCSKSVNTRQASLIDSRVQNAIAFMEENLFKPLTIEQIAEKAFLSPSGLAQLFKKSQGVSVMQWREEKRLAEACKRLLTTSDSIAVISNDLGYVSQAYFSRCFNKHMKRSPSEYRKLYSLF
ncbi:hypothetical protein EOPP23_06295 [Endozoicomonas sp. OPT23]|uniref:helix-turn-helix domain-containing protein n=1 Tax=Endozoicomonas sp. OPT23 TaxID=2072845 RepID=UPI00129B2016|nr:helix-turn-helix domain-containing protein [Endozoicomonas sp. OPT23]MRI32596.1 hypothetical protein [Endozoicomonas sp. OPT23]